MKGIGKAKHWKTLLWFIVRALILFVVAIAPFVVTVALKCDELGKGWASLAALGIEVVWLFIFSYLLVAVDSVIRERKKKKARATAAG